MFCHLELWRPTAHPAGTRNSHGAVWPSPAPLQCPSGLPRPRGHVGTSLGCLVGVWCGHGALWWPTGRGLGRALLVCRGPAVASSGPLWCPWGKPRPLQWPPDPQGPWQRPPVGWGWYGAVFRACECRKATRSGPPRPFVFLFFLAAPKKQEPPRNGIKNRALLCFEVPVASGPGVPRRQAPQSRAEHDF